VDATRRDAPRAPRPTLDALASAGAPYRVEIAGALGDVRFPPLCARCATPPAGTLTLAKMFRHVHSDSPDTRVYAAVQVPFCAPCLDAHRDERRPPDPRTLRRLRNTFLVRLLPYVIPVVVIVYMIKEFLRPTLRAVGKGDLTGALLFGAVVAFFGLLLLMFWRLVLKAREDLVAPSTGDPNAQHVEFVRGHFGATYVIPGPPTSPLAAVDFTDEDGQLFEANRRTFTFANPAVGAEFAAANAGLVWHPDSPAGRRASWLRHALFVALGVAAAIAVILHYFGGSLLGV
jgi:hypothetical protein